jgi:hypothetical protein
MTTAEAASKADASGAMVVLLTLASGHFLMTLDSSVMNVSIATVARMSARPSPGSRERSPPTRS